MAELLNTPSFASWHRRPGEPIESFEAFCTYLMQGPERTLAETGRILGKHISTMAGHSSKWSWAIRAADYEEHFMLLRLESMEAERDRAIIRQMGLIEKALSIVDQRFDQLIEVCDIDDSALVKLFAEAMKANERLMDRREQGMNEMDSLSLADRYAEELAGLLNGIMEELQLTPDQQELAKQAISKKLTASANGSEPTA